MFGMNSYEERKKFFSDSVILLFPDVEDVA